MRGGVLLPQVSRQDGAGQRPVGIGFLGKQIADSVVRLPMMSSWLVARRSPCYVCQTDVQYGRNARVVEA